MIERLFFSVGAMKAGTTWLQRQLRSHPEIHFTPEKEIHFFVSPTGAEAPMRLADRLERFKRVTGNLRAERFTPTVRENLGWYAKLYLREQVDDDWYEGLFQRPNARTYCADFSNLYSLLDEARWRHVRQMCKELKVLYTLRHPAERLWSHLKFHFEFSGNYRAFTSWSSHEYDRFFNEAHVRQQSELAKNVERLRLHLGDQELKIMFFENFRGDPQSALNELEAFLGIDQRHYKKAHLSRQVNASEPLEMPRTFKTFAQPYHYGELAKLSALGLQIPRSWQNF